MVNVINLVGEISAPTGMWASILNWIEGSVVNYGWVIVLFTLLVKVCLSPLDFLMKFNTKKSSLVQQKLAPQIARINQKYQDDKNTAQLQTNALYKKEGYNVFGSCILMIINLAITMTVFLTLFNSLREISAYKAIKQYAELEQTYVTTYEQHIDSVKTNFQETIVNDYDGKIIIINPETGEITDDQVVFVYSDYQSAVDLFYDITTDPNLTQEEKEAQENLIKSTLENKYVKYVKDGQENISLQDLLITCSSTAIDAASEETYKAWQNVKDSWLWIENLWVADNYKSPLPTYADLKNLAESSKINSYKKFVKNNIDNSLHTTVTSSVHSKIDRWNGYFVLAILAGVTSFLSQFISERMSKSKNKQVNQLVEKSNPNGNGVMKFMKILLPAMMVIFVITSSAAFGIYIVTSSIISIGISALTSVIVNRCYRKKEQEIMEQLEKQVIKSAKRSKRGL